MGKRKYPRSLAKYIRQQKALIRRKTANQAEQERLIKELITRVRPLSKEK